jgi:putative exosortase-associated protein (TIGR04073 family)
MCLAASAIWMPRGRNRHRGFSAFWIALIVIAAATPAWAQSTSDGSNAGDKALRGLANIMTGVMAFPGEIRQTWNEDGPAMGLTVGVAKGVSMIVMRELVGVLELLSSPAPWPNGDFSPILEPDYPWHYFKE